MSFSLQINADNPEDLKRSLEALAAAFGGVENFARHMRKAEVTTDGITAEMGPPEVVALTPPDTAPATAPIAPLSTATTEEQPPPGNVVKELTIPERRSAGVKMLLDLFNKDQRVMPQLANLQAKYGVKKFDEISDDRVPDFYNDVLLTVNGTAEVQKGA
ncbi:MAG: hypothetical protein J0I48_19100 [Devosia sp.]|uniref:hypothetical protein n=1 Tax=Devosia sp. 66-22 TaxID=1895753 RepID=UPI000927B841|nr:hypothetical protein [Devosia sp. 66-22]MBN9348274.1 hypothetical protein [Devosia sp.]OJX48985.1 MAG: hypothetical protein BGO81_10345 [Devosia sp. 66-22]